MITGKINLAKFEHVLRKFKNKKGEEEECIVIPIKRNKFFRSEKGNVFVDIVAFDKKPEHVQNDETHSLKQSLSKDELAKMKEKGEYTPFIGDLRVSGGGGNEQPNTSDDFSDEAGADDLPF